MAGDKSDSAPGARGDEPREPGAFCVPRVRTEEMIYLAVMMAWGGALGYLFVRSLGTL